MAFEVTRASGSEAKVLAGMLEGLFGKAPAMAERCADFSADRGLDNASQKALLWDKWTIRPLIDTRLMWRAEKDEPGYDPERPITRALFADRADVVVHDERGRVSCICPETGEQRAMAFQGFEAGRGACGTLKYRCPNCLRPRLRRPRSVPPRGRRIARRVRPHRTHRSRQPRPAHGHAHAVSQPSWRRGTTGARPWSGSTAALFRASASTHYIRGLAKMKRVGLALAVMMAWPGQARAGNADAWFPGRPTPRHRLTFISLLHPDRRANAGRRETAAHPWRCSLLFGSPKRPFRSISRPGAGDIELHPDRLRGQKRHRSSGMVASLLM